MLVYSEIRTCKKSETNADINPTSVSNSLAFCVGTALSSQAVSSQVLSTLVSLTSVFGMGTGGSSPPLAPTICSGDIHF